MIDLSVHIQRMTDHIEADELVRGIGFEDGKGCFIGCTFDRYDHEHAAKTTGVPEWLWYLADELHENMSRSVDRGDMAMKLLRGFEQCEDFASLERAIHIYIQRQNIERVTALDIDAALKSDVLAAIDAVISCHAAALPFDAPEWVAAAAAAQVSVTAESWSAEGSAAAAARSAAAAAEWSAEWSAAEKWSAEWSAAARSAAAAEGPSPEKWPKKWPAAAAEWSAAEAATYDDIGQELLRLLGVDGPALLLPVA